MKTSILVDRSGRAEIFTRALLPSDHNPDARDGWIEAHTPRYVPAHDYKAQPVSFDGKPNKMETRHAPDQVILDGGSTWRKVTRGAVDGARVIPPEYADELARIDEQIEALHKRSKQVMAEAWRRGRPLRVADLNHHDE